MSSVSSKANISSSLTGSVVTGTPIGALNQNWSPKSKEINKSAKGEIQTCIISDTLAINMMKNLIKENYMK